MNKSFRLGAMLVAGLGCALVQRRLTRYEIVDRSMQPTLESGDYVLADKRGRRPDRGSIIVYSDSSGVELVKRVIGLPGEIVEIADGAVIIDGAALADPWGKAQTEPSGTWVLGSDEVFTLGDARARSAGDSRSTGGVELQRIRGRVMAIYWPLDRVRIISR